jgi:hypothetical protein
MVVRRSVNLFLISAIFFAGCKKNDINESTNCKLIPSVDHCNLIKEATMTYDNGNSSTTFFEYDSEDRLVKQTRDADVIVFNYPDERTMTTTYDSYKRTWVTGDDSRVSEYSIMGTDTVIQKYFYDDNGILLKSVSMQYDALMHGYTDTDDYYNVMVFCNVVKWGRINAYDDEYAYYEDYPNNKQYPFGFSEYHAGYRYSKNLLKEIKSYHSYEHATQTFSYEFDAKGRISKETQHYHTTWGKNGSNFTSVTTYKYQCD